MKQAGESKALTFKRSTVVIAAIVAVLLLIATGLTVGLAGRGRTTAETVRPIVQISANTDTSVMKQTELSTVDLVEAVADTVVEITTSEVTTDAFMREVIQAGAGSGVIIDKTGYIITNEHVVSGANTVSVRLPSGAQYAAEIVAADAETDIAVIKIQPTDALPTATFGNSDALKVGQSVIAIGNPLGSLGGTVTEGIISATNRAVTIDGVTMNLLQTSAAVNPGNSGGGLFNTAGELIGVVNAKSSGSGIEGLAFAIPANTALQVATQLIEQGYVTGRTDAGLTLVDISDRISAMINGVDYLGVYVKGVSKTYVGDLQARDHIYEVNGKQITTVAEWKAIVRAGAVGDTLDIVYYRGNERRETTLTLVQYNPADYTA